MASLNFNKIKKEYLTVTLPDENNTTILVGTPKKAIMDILIELQINIQGANESEVIDNLFDVMARVMSNNKGGIKITKDYLENVFDIEDIMVFFTAYMEFIGGISKSNEKN